MNYIDNAKIIPLDDLPKIGQLDRYHGGVVCSIEAYEDARHPDYIFYTVKFSERLKPGEIKYFMFGVDTYTFSYAVKITDFDR